MRLLRGLAEIERAVDDGARLLGDASAQRAGLCLPVKEARKPHLAPLRAKLASCGVCVLGECHVACLHGGALAKKRHREQNFRGLVFHPRKLGFASRHAQAERQLVVIISSPQLTVLRERKLPHIRLRRAVRREIERLEGQHALEDRLVSRELLLGDLRAHPVLHDAFHLRLSGGKLQILRHCHGLLAKLARQDAAVFRRLRLQRGGCVL